MAIAKTILFLLMIALLPEQTQAQKYKLSDFKETALPKSNSNEWLHFLHDTYDYKISYKRGMLKIDEVPSNNYIEEVELQIDGGKLIATNEGEFRGELTFEADDGRSILIKQGNFPFLFFYKKQIYFIDTFAPNKFDLYKNTIQGALYKLVKQSDKYTYSKIFDFDEFPGAMCISKDDIMLVSDRYLYKIHNLRKEIIFNTEALKSDTINTGFGLNSIAVKGDKYVYMGTRGGYLQFNLIDKSYKYYKLTK